MNKEMQSHVGSMILLYTDDPTKAADPKAIEEFFKLIVEFISKFEVSTQKKASKIK